MALDNQLNKDEDINLYYRKNKVYNLYIKEKFKLGLFGLTEILILWRKNYEIEYKMYF